MELVEACKVLGCRWLLFLDSGSSAGSGSVSIDVSGGSRTSTWLTAGLLIGARSKRWKKAWDMGWLAGCGKAFIICTSSRGGVPLFYGRGRYGG